MKKYPIIIIVFIALLLPIIWLRDGLTVAYAESGFLFFLNSPRRALGVTFFAWWDKFSFGVDNIRALPLNSFFLLTSILEFIGLSPLARQYLIFAAILLLSSLSMYYLILELFDKKQWPAFFASLFFIFNPYTMNIWHRFTSAIFGLPLMPLAMLLTVRIIKKPSFKKSFLFALAVLLFSVNAVNPGYFLPLLLPAILYACLFARKLKQWRYLFLASVLTLGVNFWWLLPLSSNISGEITKASAYLNPLATLEEISRWLPLSFLIRLIDKTTIRWVGVNYHPGLIEWLIPVLVVIGFFFHRKNKKVLFFFGLWIMGLFFSKGLQPPGGGIFKFLFTHITAFQIFRSPFEKFGLIIAFAAAVLTAFGIYWLFKKIKHEIGKWIFLFLTSILLLIVPVWPMWSGDLFSFWQGGVPAEAKEIPSVGVAIPQYWREAANHLNQKKDSSRILFLPQSSFDAIWYRWPSGYWGCEGGVELLFDNPTISYFINHPQAEQTRETIEEKILNEGIDAAVPILGLINIKNILVRNDVNDIGAKTITPKKINSIIERGELTIDKQSFGQLDLYQIDNSYSLPLFYSPQELIYLSGNTKSIASITSLQDYLPQSAFFYKPFQDQAANNVFAQPEISDYRLLNQIKKLSEEGFRQTPKPINLNQLPIESEIKEIVLQINPLIQKYQLQIPQNGHYSLLFKNPDGLSIEKLKNWQITIDEVSLDGKSLRERKDQWINFADYNFKTSRQKMTVKTNNQPANIVDNKITDWQAGTWYQITGYLEKNSGKILIEEQVRDWQKSGYYLKTKINSGSIYYIQQNNKFTIWLKSDADAVSAKISNLSKEIKDLKIIPFWQPAILWQLTDAPIIPEKQIPQISFKKINSVKYQVNIENVPDPYTLIFSQSFHPGWHLYYQKKQISQNTHQLVNGFANAWQITPQMVEENEDYQLTLKFQPQRLFYLGLIIAAATLLIAIGYMFWHATSKV